MMIRIRRHSLGTFLLLLLPGLYITALFILPLASAVGLSFEAPDWTLRHYSRLIDVPVYRAVYLKTLRVAFLTTMICLLLAYPCALFVSRLTPRARAIAVTLVTLPFMLSVLVRNYVWIILLQDAGLINRLLQGAGVTGGPVRLMYNELGVLIAMVNMLVPYVFFPVLSVLLTIPRDLELASASLGANRLRSFLTVTAPLSAAGTAAGCLLTFIVALGFYITPAMLGGTREMMVSNLIAFNVREVLNWPFAFSLGTTLLASTVVLFFIYRSLVPVETMMKPS
ncbi:MAG: binding-protein-dependent transport system inner rane component [Burkholderiales bacterium]|nr:binding-protein-dependent transport system inner rane component [Burkholderiales bacterium]